MIIGTEEEGMEGTLTKVRKIICVYLRQHEARFFRSHSDLFEYD